MPSGRVAIDIGCGSGAETLWLLHQGYSVLAIDSSPSAIGQLRSTVPPDSAMRLETAVSPAQDVDLPPADFVWAGFSLPFVIPGDFDKLWVKIVACLKPGAYFAGDFFGKRHAWSAAPTISSCTSRSVKLLCRPLQIEFFVSEEGRRMTAMSGVTHWHSFSVIARKPLHDRRAPGRSAPRRQARSGSSPSADQVGHRQVAPEYPR